MLSRLREMIAQRRRREALYSTAKYWDQKARLYEGNAVSMWPNNALNALYEHEQQVAIWQALGDVRGRKVLDAGCGSGRLSRFFAAQGAETTGMDFSEGALAIARAQSPAGNPAYRQESFFELADENAFDVVVTLASLTIACRDKSQLLDALVRMKRALREDGRLLLIEHIHRGFLHRVLDMDLPTFLAVMRDAGFEVKSNSPLHFWPMRLALAYIPWPAWITTPLYHLGQGLMKLPGLSRLGDYWAILAVPAKGAGARRSDWEQT